MSISFDNVFPKQSPSNRVLWPEERLAVDDRPGAYQWWYFDATSDDGEWTIVAIFFYGSVFSPWYTGRLLRGESARPSQHAAINLALYRRGHHGAWRWAFNEYGNSAPRGDGGRYYEVGNSGFQRSFDDGSYDLTFDEHPGLRLVRPFPLRGRIRFQPERRPLPGEAHTHVIDGEGLHRWQPAAPRCKVHAVFDAPALEFKGRGYHDCNHGDAPLHEGFQRWTWGRSHEPSRTCISYDRVLRSGDRRVLSLEIPANESASKHTMDRTEHAPMKLQTGSWALLEPAELHAGKHRMQEVTRVEASPFYARYTGKTAEGAPAVAEHLDLPRYQSSIMQFLLPFKARRIG